jgi:hypothetical protein
MTRETELVSILRDIEEWMRVPNDADHFAMQDLLDWANKCPRGKLARAIYLAARTQGGGT